MADTTADSELLAGVRRCLQKLVESKHVPLTRANSENQLENTVDTNVVLFAALLMHAGTRFGEPEMVAAGCELGQFWTAAAELRDGIYYARYMRYLWGESFAMAPCLYWLTRVTGEPHYARAADAVIERTLSRNQRATGIFDHWSDDAGGRGASWSRGNCWPVLWLTQALYAVDPASAAAERIRAALQRTFNGLAAYQNRERGLWHLVVDEAETRLEVSATVGIVYCLDRLRELGVIGAEFDAMAGSAFSGLKRMYYAAGLAGNCRGTSTGVPEYYRTRPIGYHRNSLFPGVVGPRL